MIAKREADNRSRKILIGAETHAYENFGIGGYYGNGPTLRIADCDAKEVSTAVAITMIHVGNSLDNVGRCQQRRFGADGRGSCLVHGILLAMAAIYFETTVSGAPRAFTSPWSSQRA